MGYSRLFSACGVKLPAFFPYLRINAFGVKLSFTLIFTGELESI